MYGSLVFHNAGLLYAFHKLLQLHVFFRQLEPLNSTFLVPIVMASTFPLLVPLDLTNEPFQFWPSLRLWRDFVRVLINMDILVSVPDDAESEVKLDKINDQLNIYSESDTINHSHFR